MLQDTGGYPHLNLFNMGFCVPDEHCKSCQWPGDHHLQQILNENFIKPKGADQPKGPMVFEEQSSIEHLTEGGNAHRLERIHGDDMRFNHTHKKWLVWDGGRWKVDGDGNAARLAEDVVSMLTSPPRMQPTQNTGQDRGFCEDHRQPKGDQQHACPGC
jgi:hypothetical protein